MRLNVKALSLVVPVLGIWAATAAAEVTTRSLIEEMTDLQRLCEFPDPAYTNQQFSSYDRKSTTHAEYDGWFANGDRGEYLRVEKVDGRDEYVMMDAKGPGAVVRIWSANPEGVLRIYIDGDKTPVVEAEMKALLGGGVKEFPVPIAGVRAAGYNLYFPFPYAKSCKVTSDKGDFYYHVNYRTYEPGTKVVSYQKGDVEKLSGEVTQLEGKLLHPRNAVTPPADGKKQEYSIELGAGHDALIAELDGPKAICAFIAHIDADNIPEAARAVILKIWFDDQHCVDTPLGDFFGTAPGLTPFEALPCGIMEGDPNELYSHWVMPFAKKARITVQNLGDQTVKIDGSLTTMPYRWTDESLLFFAKWRIERAIPTRPFTDWSHLQVNGKGRFVGGHLHIINPIKNWWGEGDEKIYVDGEVFPSTFGTGTEDYYGYAWCSNERFVHAYHNQPRADGPQNFGNTSNNRFHVIDDIPFTKSFRFDIENWHHKDAVDTIRAAISYWYARPGAKDFFGMITVDDAKLDKAPEYKAHRVPGAIECEQMEVLAKTGKVRKQNMPYLSNDTQLWWVDGGPGDELKLGFDLSAAQAGKKRVYIRVTKSFDYANIQCYINGEKAGPVLGLYCPHPAGTGEIDLGEFELKSGQNVLTVEIAGIDEHAEKKYMAGLDYIILK